MTEITIREAQYVDPRAGNDKFYRTFAFDSCWVSQYGRNGTLGTFTKVVDAGSPEKAIAAADAKFAAKVKKGYLPERSGTVQSPVPVDPADLSALDALAERLPKDGSASVPRAVVTAEVVAAAVENARPDAVGVLRTGLDHVYPGSRPCLPEDLDPVLPMRPMLASTLDEHGVEALMGDEDWVAQFKYDGDRVVLDVLDGAVRALNRQGEQKVRNVGQAQLRPFTALGTGRWVLDGEIVGRTLVLFDLIRATDGTTVWTEDRTTFLERQRVLSIVARVLGIPVAGSEHADAQEPVVLAPLATGREEKRMLLARAVLEQREGIVLRSSRGPYEQARRSTVLVKHKLVKDADVVVTALHASKESATLSVHRPDGSLVEVGSASTIGRGDVAVGDVWIAAFLYVTDPAHPRMVQPRLVRRRDDKTASECLLDQFAHAGTSRRI